MLRSVRLLHLLRHNCSFKPTPLRGVGSVPWYVAPIRRRKSVRLNSGVRAHMFKLIATLIAAVALSACSQNQTAPFEPADQMTFAMSTQTGYTEDFISRLKLDNGTWKIEHRNEDGIWQDVTCETKCKLSESTQQQLETLRAQAKIPYHDFKCLQDVAFALCKTGSGSNIQYFLVGGLEKSQIRVGMLKKLNPSTFKPSEP